MRLTNNKGIALVISLLCVIVLLTLSSVFVLRTITEKKTADQQARLTQAFYVTEGGAQAGLDQLKTLINENLKDTVTAANPQVLGNKANSYVTSGDGVGFLIEFVKKQGVAQLTLNGTQAIYNVAATTLGNGNYTVTIIITEKSNPVTVGVDQWDFPYYYRIQATGTVGSTPRKAVLSGDFTVRVQKDNFAKFALFTDHHKLPSGTTVWFTNKTNFAGPVHTNELLSFAFNPSGTFDGAVTQQNTKARFFNNGSSILLDADNNAPKDVPVFNAGFTRGVAQIVLESSVQKADLYLQARGGDSTTPPNGIYVANDGTALTGGIFVRGNATLTMSVDGSDNAIYTVTEGSTTKVITVDKVSNQTTVNTVGSGAVTYQGQPDGLDDLGTIIYVDGTVNSFQGTVQKDTEVTLSSENDIVIGSDVKYADYTPAVGLPGTTGYVPPSATGKTNLLGLISWGGNVRIGTMAPNNVNLHGIVMARGTQGVFTVDNYNNTTVGPRGTATLLGGVITQFYGAFGLFNSSTGQQLSGYGRNFVYDDRAATGKSPPYFPTMKTFTAFTNDITDKIVWQEGGF